MAKKQGSDNAPKPRQRSTSAARKAPGAKPAARLQVSTEGDTPLGEDEIREAWRAAGAGADERLKDAAKKIGESTFGSKAFRDLMDGMTRDVKAPISDLVREMSKGWDDRAKQLQDIQRDAFSVRSLPVIPYGPSPEVSASMAIEAQTERLVDVSIRTSEQIGQLAKLAEASLAQQVEGVAVAAEAQAESIKLREALVQFGVDSKRSARVQTFLGIVIAILTAVLVLDALNVWPFAGG